MISSFSFLVTVLISLYISGSPNDMNVNDVINPFVYPPILRSDSTPAAHPESRDQNNQRDLSNIYDFREVTRSESAETIKTAAALKESSELSLIIKQVASIKSSDRLTGLRALIANLERDVVREESISAAPSVFYKDRHLLKSLEEPLCECLLDMSSEVQMLALQCFLRFHGTNVHCKGQMACKILAAIVSKLFISKNKYVIVDSMLCAKYLVENEPLTFEVLLEGLNSKYYSVINHCLEILHFYLSLKGREIPNTHIEGATFALLKYLQNFRLDGARANIIRVCNIILGSFKDVALPILMEFIQNPLSKPEAVEQVQLLLGSIVLREDGIVSSSRSIDAASSRASESRSHSESSSAAGAVVRDYDDVIKNSFSFGEGDAKSEVSDSLTAFENLARQATEKDRAILSPKANAEAKAFHFKSSAATEPASSSAAQDTRASLRSEQAPRDAAKNDPSLPIKAPTVTPIKPDSDSSTQASALSPAKASEPPITSAPLKPIQVALTRRSTEIVITIDFVF